jgi:hypothetical protein
MNSKILAESPDTSRDTLLQSNRRLVANMSYADFQENRRLMPVDYYRENNLSKIHKYKNPKNTKIFTAIRGQKRHMDDRNRFSQSHKSLKRRRRKKKKPDFDLSFCNVGRGKGFLSGINRRQRTRGEIGK